MEIEKITAFLAHQGGIYYAEELEHPVAALIEGVWQNHADQARVMTRNRIFTKQKLSPMSEGMLKVAAKRVEVLDARGFAELISSYSGVKFIEVKAIDAVVSELPSFESKRCTVDEAMALAHEISEKSRLKIGAVLLDESDHVVSVGWNDHELNKVLHAEVMLVRNFVAKFKKKIPAGYKVVSTLQPCAMCAGYLHGHSEDFLKLKIIWDKADPGPKAQNSILVVGSDLWKKLHA